MTGPDRSGLDRTASERTVSERGGSVSERGGSEWTGPDLAVPDSISTGRFSAASPSTGPLPADPPSADRLTEGRPVAGRSGPDPADPGFPSSAGADPRFPSSADVDDDGVEIPVHADSDAGTSASAHADVPASVAFRPGTGRAPGRSSGPVRSESDAARAAEESAIEQALALVGGSGRDLRRDLSRDPGRAPVGEISDGRSRSSGGAPDRGLDDRSSSRRSPYSSPDVSTDSPSDTALHTTPPDTAPGLARGAGPRLPGSPPLLPPPLPSPPPLSWDRARSVAAQAGRSGPAAAIRLPLDRALGHALAEPLLALTDLPPFDTSAMDGWAVSGPGPWAFEAGAELLAGSGPATPLPDGTAVRIATGARVPPDTTAVVRSEHSYADGTKALLHARRPVVTGQDIRPRGQECRSGEQLVPAGTVVTPVVLGLAAAAGYDALPAVPRPRVEILVLGDELLASGLPYDGLIRDALGPMLGPWLRALGAEVTGSRRLGDDAGALREAITASDADLIITTGGTASGPVDHVHPVLDALGAELLVDGVAVRPGHPMLLARLSHDGPYLVGLPGNPLAAVSGLLTLAEPLLAGISGRPAQDAYRALVHAEVHGHPHDTRLVPVVHRAGRAGGRDHVAPLRYNGPAMLRGIAAADGLAVVEPGGVRSGTEVEILDLPWAPAAPWTEGCFT